MRARARIEFGMTELEFWDTSEKEWEEYCHVGDRAMILLDKQFAETRHMIYNMLSSDKAPNKNTSDFRLLQDPSEPDADDFFDAFAMLL